MKKYIIWCLCLFAVTNSVFAQQDTKTMDVKVDGTAFAEMWQKIQNVELDFCDKYGSKSIAYDYALWWERDVCFNVYNGSDRDVVVNLWFVDGMFTNDQWKNRACWTAEDIDSFGQYVTWYQNTIVLKKSESKTAHATIKYPEDMVFTWENIEGCLVYSLVADSTWASQSVGFGVIVRKAKFITLNIKKAPMFDIGYLSIVGIIVISGIVIYRKKIFSSKWK